MSTGQRAKEFQELLNQSHYGTKLCTTSASVYFWKGKSLRGGVRFKRNKDFLLELNGASSGELEEVFMALSKMDEVVT